MNKISAKIVADSINEFGDRITSMVCVFPRFILAELNTHRVFSRNSASSRAVPFNTMVKAVQDDPFIPIAWQREHKGMQGTEYLNWSDKADAEAKWLTAMHYSIKMAEGCSKELKATKQLCNRLLEPFMWHTCIITSTEWENFFNLRCPQYVVPIHGGEEHKEYIARSRKEAIKMLKENGEYPETTKFLTDLADEIDWLYINKGQAEIHMMALAEAIYDTINESIPQPLKADEWHVPFGNRIDSEKLRALVRKIYPGVAAVDFEVVEDLKVKIATARCARVSYINYEGKDDYEADVELYNRLVSSGSSGAFHASPFEHCARTMSKQEREYYGHNLVGNTIGCIPSLEEEGWCRNFRGFIQLRHLIEK